jgi:hypothetical protein
MTDEAKKTNAWLAFCLVIGALFGFAVLSRAFNSPKADAPNDSAYATGPYAPRDGGESARIHFGADKAMAIAIAEVKRREGWSGNPNWVSADFDEGPSWLVTVRRHPHSSQGERRVLVSAMTGKVDDYADPSLPR